MPENEHSWKEELAEFNDYPPEMREILNDFVSELEAFRCQIALCPKENPEFIEKMAKLWESLTAFYEKDVDGKLYEAFEKSNYFLQHQEEFSEWEAAYVRNSETQEASAIMHKDYRQSFVKMFDRRLSKETYEQTRAEMEMLDEEDRNCPTLVMIGCGPCPETMLFLSDNTGIQNIVGLDNEPTAVYMAGGLVHALGQDKKIKIIESKGENYNYGDADVIWVANYVRNKEQVFQQIAKTAKQGTKIITRNSVSLGRMFYEITERCIPPCLTVKKRGEVNPYFLFYPMLLQKESVEI